MTDTINNKIPFVPENTIDPAAGLNLSLNSIDALLQVLVQTVGANIPPGAPVNGSRYIVGAAPTGAWVGQANKLARFLDGAWQFFDARYVLNAADGAVWVRSGSTWAALAGGGGGSGTVTSVGLEAPLGFEVSGSPITGAGTLGLSFSAGYSLPSNADQANWGEAFGWGNHALAGYEKALTAGANITIDRTDPDNPVISSTAAGGGGGDVVGPTSATTNGVALFDGISGKVIKDGGVLGSAAFTDSADYLSADYAVFKNKIINGNPIINQRAVSGTVVLSAGAYGHDRWKAGAAGCTYTFTTVAGETIFTISAGSLVHVIEGNNLLSGPHTLRWSGTAQGKIGAGAYSTTGVTATVTGGVNLSIEFGVGTLGLVRFTQGTVSTQFEQRLYGDELTLCQRYCFAKRGVGVYALGQVLAISTVYAFVDFPVEMRATPSLAISGISAATAGGGSAVANTAVITNANLWGANLNLGMSSASFVPGDASIVNGNSAGSFIIFTADL